MEPRISIITLGVSDLRRSIEFYRDGLGLPLRDGSGEDIAFFETSGTWLALYPRADMAAEMNVPVVGAGPRDFTLAHNARTREEVDRTIEEAVAAGAALVKRPQEADWGGYSGYFSDPDGFLWEVAWNPQFWIE